MHPVFGINREMKNELFIYDYTDFKMRNFHFHSLVEIILVREGSVDVCIGEKNRVISSGEIAVAVPFEAHSFYSPDPVRATILFIPLFLCEEFVSAMKNKNLSDPFFVGEDAKKMRECFDLLSAGGLERIEEIGYVYIILGSVLKNAKPKDSIDISDTDLGSKLLFYINENFKENIDLTKISSNFGYSSNYISKHFKSTFKIGIKQYISTVRLKNAVMLIRERKYSITECAFESGFSSVRSFYRAFYSEFKCSPREYLERENI